MNHLKGVLCLDKFLLTLPALLFAINIAFSSFSITQIVLFSNNDRYKALGLYQILISPLQATGDANIVQIP
jgi:hypothetical protein